GTNQKNPCSVNGVTYQDGETFAPDCSQVCTCQNGFYGCSSRCPHELTKPSEDTCPEPKLMKVKDECCRQWTCQKIDTTHAPPTTTLAYPPWRRGEANGPCPQGSDWTPCSITCGTGVSVRTIVDPVSCATAQEQRLCLLRPCEEKFERETCTATVKLKEKRRILYQDCISVKTYRLRFCDTCRKRKCCFPKRTRHRKIEFQCSQGKREVFNFMWIKKCRCAKKCYGEVENPGKRRKERERNKRRRQESLKRRERERSKKRRERARNKKRRERERNKKKREKARDEKRRDKERADKRGRRCKNNTQ
ncbi:hypothetical protein EGW08_015329, partial [Elysia chlorotica]